MGHSLRNGSLKTWLVWHIWNNIANCNYCLRNVFFKSKTFEVWFSLILDMVWYNGTWGWSGDFLFTGMSSRWRRCNMASKCSWRQQRLGETNTSPPCPHSPGASWTAHYLCLFQFVCRSSLTQPGHKFPY